MVPDLKTPADHLWGWMADDLNGTATLDILYPGRTLASLAAWLGLSFPGHRIEKIPRGELLDAGQETLRAQPAERRRVLDKMVAMLEPHGQDASGLRSCDVRRWLGVRDDATGIRGLLAIIAFGSAPAVRAAQRWWRESISQAAGDVATYPSSRQRWSGRRGRKSAHEQHRGSMPTLHPSVRRAGASGQRRVRATCRPDPAPRRRMPCGTSRR